ncbi:class I SAM-dependent methyltransferase [Halapricum hydrolyticum]|uniref:Class I SAM-dependent methyltransferase n=1 Tax=Halapricum hydrolyticum TaxID=2979991 RepID=A0AAE3IBJ3_9EURY|nr:class I SAM-dependent methyltransferase [Halapricum hydrolyticum]MCU4717937.1 class I SAM-dependent methyltransferase [Halapricum hydrolyticum]MCU4727102.1 class I SAM-dependent methyltransferase [Halapricum hydrolyticum]
MPNAAPFEEHTDRYEAWFDEYEAVYESELNALDRLLDDGRALEVGVGSGRFAAPLGIDIGVDPTIGMLQRARRREIDVVRGVAEQLPFAEETFETVLLVTTICFVEDVPATLAEARRVLAPDGDLVLGYVDRHSPVGEIYEQHKEESPFYRDATFVSTDQLRGALLDAGFTDFEIVQTVFRWIDEVDEPEPVEPGYGDGSFVVIKARR